jgi:hypothetical protein
VISTKNPTDKELADWVVSTCLLFGGTLETAYIVAGYFVQAVKDARQQPAQETDHA